MKGDRRCVWGTHKRPKIELLAKVTGSSLDDEDLSHKPGSFSHCPALLALESMRIQEQNAGEEFLSRLDKTDIINYLVREGMSQVEAKAHYNLLVEQLEPHSATQQGYVSPRRRRFRRDEDNPHYGKDLTAPEDMIDRTPLTLEQLENFDMEIPGA